MSYRSTALVGTLALVGLSALALVASAQAITPGFLISKKPVGTLSATFGAEQIGRSSLLMPSLNSEVNCERLTAFAGAIQSKADAKGQLLFSECTVLSISPLGGISCTVENPITLEALFLPAETSLGDPALLAEKIKMLVRTLGVECPLPEDSVVTGELCLRIVNNDTVEPRLSASQAIQGDCKERSSLEASTEGFGVKDKLLYGKQEAFLDFTVVLFLTGAHEGLTLGVSLY